MSRSLTIFAVTLISFTGGNSCDAQITLQQPIFSQFSISTTVSVPDRGWAHLGGVKRAFSSRSQHGFFRPGSSIGHERMYSGMSAGVTIIDLGEMDRMILGYDPSMLPRGRYPVRPGPSPEQLKQQREKLTESRKPGLASAWFKLGKNAEESGRLDRARKCYDRARKYGSVGAGVRLAALDRPKPSPVVTTKSSVPATKATTINSGPKLLAP